jgi:hypothetical protein
LLGRTISAFFLVAGVVVVIYFTVKRRPTGTD